MRTFLKQTIFFSIVSVGVFVQIALAQEVNQQFEGFNLQGYTDEGEKSWDVNGITADIIGKRVQLKGVNANVYEGDQKINIRSNIGVMDPKNKQVELQDEVVLSMDKQLRLTTDSLYWDQGADLITTEDDILVTGEEMTVSGNGLELWPKQKRLRMRHNVRALIKFDTHTKEDNLIQNIIKITSDGVMIIDQLQAYVIFEDNVVVIQKDQVLKSDRVEIRLNSEMNDILEIVGEGKVEIIRGENKTYANRAIFDCETRNLTLSGRSKVILLTEGEDKFESFRN